MKVFSLGQNVQQLNFRRCISARACFSTSCALGHNTFRHSRYHVLNPV